MEMRNSNYDDLGVCPVCGRTDIGASCRRNLCLECFCYVVNHMDELTNLNPVNYDQRMLELKNMGESEFRSVCSKMAEIVNANPQYYLGSFTLDRLRRMQGYAKKRNAYFGSDKIKEFVEQSTGEFTAQHAAEATGCSRNYASTILNGMVNDGKIATLPRDRMMDAIRYVKKEN